jgi:hypothetical protein
MHFDKTTTPPDQRKVRERDFISNHSSIKQKRLVKLLLIMHYNTIVFVSFTSLMNKNENLMIQKKSKFEINRKLRWKIYQYVFIT